MSGTAFGLTDVGRKRENNQDHLIVDDRRQVFAIADGMGGHAAGEVASRLAIEAVAETFPERNSGDDSIDPRDAERLIDAAFHEGNRRICESVISRGELRGMGTTIVALVQAGSEIVIAHVGDSRAYRLREGELERLTDDHSWVGEQVKLGLLTDEEAHRHPMRNIVTRALGNRTDLRTSVVRESVRPEDIVLLCSDGLNTMLTDAEICETLVSVLPDTERACRALVDRANERGGDDNISVIVWRAPADNRP